MRDGQGRLTTFDPQGNVVFQHQSNYQVGTSGQVKILTYSNVLVTAGVETGHLRPGPFSYAYRVDGDKFYEVRGLLADTPESFDVIVWERMPAKK